MFLNSLGKPNEVLQGCYIRTCVDVLLSPLIHSLHQEIAVPELVAGN
jgi:hypothetical protein